MNQKKTDRYKKANIYMINSFIRRRTSWETWAKCPVFAEYRIVRLTLFSLLFEGEISFHQAVTAAVAQKIKGASKKVKKSKTSFFFLWFTFLIPYHTITPAYSANPNVTRQSSDVLTTHYFTHFQSELKTNLPVPFKEHQTLSLQRGYKWSPFNSPGYTNKLIVLINDIIHTLTLGPSVLSWRWGLSSGQSKRPNHFLRNTFVVISLPLLPPFCFHVFTQFSGALSTAHNN